MARCKAAAAASLTGVSREAREPLFNSETRGTINAGSPENYRRVSRQSLLKRRYVPLRRAARSFTRKRGSLGPKYNHESKSYVMSGMAVRDCEFTEASDMANSEIGKS